MTTARSCSWCASMNPVGRAKCHICGHRADRPRMQCDCPLCTKPTPVDLRAKVVHCWTGRKDWAEETYGYFSPEHAEASDRDGICMLLSGHDGPHEWTPTDEIVVSFPPAPDGARHDHRPLRPRRAAAGLEAPGRGPAPPRAGAAETTSNQERTRAMCLNTCRDQEVLLTPDWHLCRECADEYEAECNPNSARNRTLRTAEALAAITPATDAEWLAWRRETTHLPGEGEYKPTPRRKRGMY